ncbi:hypothetical protein O3M35_011397 [Rhynocoris fuscipes]|uniref:Fatty acid synthase n=1 Tax=Rhynocoris fuscipes TaxID=488301 RepID=A0AAW1CYR0_9HEMI
MFITTVKYGELSSLKWVETPLTYYKPKVDADLCTVCCASLNFLDIVAATGQLPLDYIPQYKNSNIYPGIEFAGYDSKGNRVMGITPHSSLATHTMVELDYKIPVPKEWTIEQAATVPVAYATCYYGLIIRGQMKRGESILIHSGAGGVGLAAITLALSMDCELADNHIGNSRDTSFERMIMKETSGRGVDLVLNSLTGDKFQASFRCLAYNGRFIEIGKADLVRNAELGMIEFLKNISVHAIFLNYFHEDFLKKTGDGKRTMQLLKDGIASGVVRPLPSSVFESHQLEQSFRHMTTGKHIGKVLVKVRDEKEHNVCKITSEVSEIYFDAHKSYIIIGGLGGFGLELANWMITRGAKILILTSNSGIRNGYQKLRLNYWKENGISVIVSKENCLTLCSTQNLINLANKSAPVGGIFHLALVLRDGNLVEQTKENFEEVCNSKYKTALNLDKVSREYCELLEYFVVFSSQLCGRGNAESSSYAMANSAMERICEERKSEGFPAVSIS